MLNEPQKKWTSVFLILVILIDFMGVATVVTLFPQILLGPHSIFPEEWSNSMRLSCMGIMLAIYPLGQFFGASLFGKLSDLHGRKKILLVTLIGTLVGFSFSAFAVELSTPILLFIGRLLSGFCAGNVAIAQASLLDISTEETRARNISYGQMAMGSAYIVGPILGALLSQPHIVSWFSMSTPFWFFTAILALFVLITISFYHETLDEKKATKVNFLEGIQQIYLGLTDAKLGKALFTWLIFVSGWWLFESYMPAYLLQSFHFTTIQVGILLAFNGALYASFQYAVVQRIAKKLSAQTMARSSLWLAGVAIVSIVITQNIFQLYLAMIIFVIAMGFGIPGLITQISTLADAKDQGQTMGMVNSIQAFATVAVMLLGGYLDGINNATTVVGGGVLVILSWVVFGCAFGFKQTQSKCIAATKII
ncbi:MAG: rane protein of unknown function [Gammaproteobacteria bacterium]|jgi:MFS family permease|nr:rane protein of unknown function [Gammaproteobacteria bacterium]